MAAISYQRSAFSSDLALLTRELEHYAERGIFRSFSHKPAAGGRTEFHFHWLWNLAFHLTFDPEQRALQFKKLLPNVPAGSDLETELKEFLHDCSSPDRPEHRRADPKRLAVRSANRRGALTLTFVVEANDYSYAVKKAIHLVNELFVAFLSVRYPECMAQNFHLSNE